MCLALAHLALSLLVLFAFLFFFFSFFFNPSSWKSPFSLFALVKRKNVKPVKGKGYII